MKMENVFTEFVGTYWEDIADFLKAFIDFVKSLIGKFNGEEEAE